MCELRYNLGLFVYYLRMVCFIGIVLEVGKELLRETLEVKELLKEMRDDMEHLHYICSRRRGGGGGNESFVEERQDRLTQYVPCSNLDDLIALESKLLDEEFRMHCVSEKCIFIL